MKNGKKYKAVFLDRDGTLIEDLGYNSDPEKIIPLPGVFEGLKKLSQSGFLLVIISNQSGVSRGFFSIEQLENMNSGLRKTFEKEGIHFAGVYCCVHSPEENCACRKPKPDLILKAAEELNIDISSSIMVGDKISDIEAGISAGCKLNILLNLQEIPNTDKFIVVKNFSEAVSSILES